SPSATGSTRRGSSATSTRSRSCPDGVTAVPWGPMTTGRRRGAPVPDDTPAPTEISGPLAGVVKGALRRAVRGQRGAAREDVAGIRRKHPQEGPARLRRRPDARHRLAVSPAPAAAGAPAPAAGGA